MTEMSMAAAVRHFAELDASTNRLARARAELGVGRDDFVTEPVRDDAGKVRWSRLRV